MPEITGLGKFWYLCWNFNRTVAEVHTHGRVTHDLLTVSTETTDWRHHRFFTSMAAALVTPRRTGICLGPFRD